MHDTASDRDGHPNPALVGIEQLFLEADNNALAFLLAFPFRYMVDIGSLILARRVERISQTAESASSKDRRRLFPG